MHVTTLQAPPTLPHLQSAVEDTRSASPTDLIVQPQDVSVSPQPLCVSGTHGHLQRTAQLVM